MPFTAPINEQNFVLNTIVGMEELASYEKFAEATPDLVGPLSKGWGNLPLANLNRSTALVTLWVRG